MRDGLTDVGKQTLNWSFEKIISGLGSPADELDGCRYVLSVGPRSLVVEYPEALRPRV